MSIFKSQQSPIFVGVHYQAPYYYLTGIQASPTFELIKIFDSKIVLAQWEFHRFSIYIASLPLSLFQFKKTHNPEGLSTYLGLQAGISTYLKAEFIHSSLEEQLLRWGEIATYLDILEIDVFALWHLAYWHLSEISGREQVLLWIYQTTHCYYVFWGRDDMLWQVKEFGSLNMIHQWLKEYSWPQPERLILFHAINIDSLELTIPVTQLTNAKPARLLAWSLALRGAYAAI